MNHRDKYEKLVELSHSDNPKFKQKADAWLVVFPPANFETDEDRLFFLVRIPCHKGSDKTGKWIILK